MAGVPPRIKVCGLTRAEDAQIAAAAGAEYLGVVLAPGGKRTVTARDASVILEGVSPRRVGVFVDAGREELLSAAEIAGLDILQLHGNEPPALAAELRADGLEVWKAVRPRSAEEFSAAVSAYGRTVDALLLDGWSPAAHGGTGARFPWEEVAGRLGELPARVRLVVAGGLRPDNVADAARILRPHAVDVSSGVESAPGEKDPDRVRAFAAAVRALASEFQEE